MLIKKVLGFMILGLVLLLSLGKCELTGHDSQAGSPRASLECENTLHPEIA